MEQVKALSLGMFAMLFAMSAAHAQPTPGKETGGSKPPEDSLFTIENSLTIRDPFRRPAPTGANGGDASVPELERFDIEKFKLVGVITGPKRAKALITTPSGKMHIVQEDTRIGSRRGYIKRISPGMIVIEEKVVNLLGQEESIETPIELKEIEQKRE